MVPILARDSIVLKCRQKQNSILGNYECAYALGLMSHLSGIALRTDEQDMIKIHQDFVQKMKTYQPTTVEEKKLCHMICSYKPVQDLDEQMQELIKWGLEEEAPWKI